MDEWVRAARVVRTKNLGGSLVCRAADGLPFLLREGLSVRFVPPTLKGPRGGCVERLFEAGEGVWEVTFKGIKSIEDAQVLVGSTCLARASDVSIPSVAGPFEHMLGCTLVEATAGKVGVIEEVRPGPVQSWLVVRTFAGGQVLVPAVDAFLGPVDSQTHTVHATLPVGLLELEGGQL